MAATGMGGDIVQARVDVVEPLGNETLVYLMPALASEQRSFIARFGAEVNLRAGQELDVAFDVERSHVFAKPGGQRII